MATERVRRRGTTGSRGRRDWDVRLGAPARSSGRMGSRTLGRGRSPCRNEEEKKKKKGRPPKDLFGRRPVGERRGLIPVAPAGAQQQDLDVNQTDKMTPPPITCIWEAFKGLRVGERGEEGARTGLVNGDDVDVARWSCAAHPSQWKLIT